MNIKLLKTKINKFVNNSDILIYDQLIKMKICKVYRMGHSTWQERGR